MDLKVQSIFKTGYRAFQKFLLIFRAKFFELSPSRNVTNSVQFPYCTFAIRRDRQRESWESESERERGERVTGPPNTEAVARGAEREREREVKKVIPRAQRMLDRISAGMRKN